MFRKKLFFNFEYIHIVAIIALILIAIALYFFIWLPMSSTSKFASFDVSNQEICKENGKPLVILFSTTWCPHCAWIKETFDSTVKKYVNEGKIVAYHWELNTGDNTLTAEPETKVPEKYLQIFQQFSGGSVPTFVFGCKYYRVGNAYEASNDLESEKADFELVIEELLK